jgi:hypothetical protein
LRDLWRDVTDGEGFRMPARGDLSARTEGRRPKAPQEGTRGGPCGRLPSMGICRGGGGLRGGCAGRRSWHRIDDRGPRIVVAAAVEEAILA